DRCADDSSDCRAHPPLGTIEPRLPAVDPAQSRLSAAVQLEPARAGVVAHRQEGKGLFGTTGPESAPGRTYGSKRKQAVEHHRNRLWDGAVLNLKPYRTGSLPYIKDRRRRDRRTRRQVRC